MLTGIVFCMEFCRTLLDFGFMQPIVRELVMEGQSGLVRKQI